LLDEGKHHVVVNKPANMVVVPGRGVPGPTLLDVVQEKIGRGARPVHRLDRPTTGCCLFARTAFGEQTLTDAFRRRLVDKRYLALVEGVPEWTKQVLDERLKRVDKPDARKGPLAWQTVAPDGQSALTRVRVLARGEERTLVEARLETGRMHQIRVHLAHAGFPLVGDELYGNAEREDALSLHAWLLSFPSPDGGRRFVAAPLPSSFTDTLNLCGIDARKLLAAEAKTFLRRPEPQPQRTAKTTKSAPTRRSKAAVKKPGRKRSPPRQRR